MIVQRDKLKFKRRLFMQCCAWSTRMQSMSWLNIHGILEQGNQSKKHEAMNKVVKISCNRF